MKISVSRFPQLAALVYVFVAAGLGCQF